MDLIELCKLAWHASVLFRHWLDQANGKGPGPQTEVADKMHKIYKWHKDHEEVFAP